jgi:6-pyruvoyltetrahydropterin/6-carboxytetrahydropterin synthase
MDFRELRAAVDRVLGRLDHADLNRLPAFRKANPTSENIARYLHERLSARLNGPTCRVHRVTVYETPRASASYWIEPATTPAPSAKRAPASRRTAAPRRRQEAGKR